MHSLSALFTDLTFLFTLAGSLLLIYAAINRAAPRWQLYWIAFLLPALFIAGGLANHAVIRRTPTTLDAAFLRIDGGISMAIYHWALAHPASGLPVNLVYCGLPLVAALVLCTSPRRITCTAVLLVASALAPLFYLICPAVGPAHLGQPGEPRNCMPSLHLTWALLLAWYSARQLRPAAWIFAALTAFATLATGEHYWIDLVAAIVYSACFVAIAQGWKKYFPPLPAVEAIGAAAAESPDGRTTPA